MLTCILRHYCHSVVKTQHKRGVFAVAVVFVVRCCCLPWWHQRDGRRKSNPFHHHVAGALLNGSNDGHHHACGQISQQQQRNRGTSIAVVVVCWKLSQVGSRPITCVPQHQCVCVRVGEGPERRQRGRNAEWLFACCQAAPALQTTTLPSQTETIRKTPQRKVLISAEAPSKSDEGEETLSPPTASENSKTASTATRKQTRFAVSSCPSAASPPSAPTATPKQTCSVAAAEA